MDFDPVAASGESTYRGSRPLELNEVSINGDADVTEVSPGQFKRNGGFFRKRILVGKPRDQKPEEHNLGETASVIFLKIRRKLVQRGDKGKVLFSTNEHNHANDIVDLYGEEGYLRSGNAKSIREAYPGLRTVQIIYALLLTDAQPELVRITIKGSSLGSEAKSENTTDFYKYLSGFTGDEHFWQYVTEMHSVLEKGQKSYFSIDFKRGYPLEDAMQKLALEQMKAVHETCVDNDKARAEKRAAGAPIAPNVGTTPEVEHPEAGDEIDRGFAAASEQPNPDDIPF